MLLIACTSHSIQIKTCISINRDIMTEIADYFHLFQHTYISLYWYTVSEIAIHIYVCRLKLKGQNQDSFKTVLFLRLLMFLLIKMMMMKMSV